MELKWIGYSVFALLILMCFAVAVSGFVPRRTIKGKFDKTIIYLFAEYSYKPQLVDSLAEILHLQNSHAIRVPLSVTWAGAIMPQFNKISSIGAMFSGMFAVLLFGSTLTGYVLIKNAVIDGYIFLVVVLLITVTFGYYYKSVASDFSYIEENYITTALNIKRFHFCKDVLDEFDLKVVDQIFNEIKLDLDINKTNVGFGGIILLLFPILFTSSSKLSDSVPPAISISFTAMIAITTVLKWMYENYRSRVIYIGANALARLKIMQQ